MYHIKLRYLTKISLFTIVFRLTNHLFKYAGRNIDMASVNLLYLFTWHDGVKLVLNKTNQGQKFSRFMHMISTYFHWW